MKNKSCSKKITFNNNSGCIFVSIIVYFCFILNKIPSSHNKYFNEANYFFLFFIIILYKESLDKLNYKIILSIIYFYFS